VEFAYNRSVHGAMKCSPYEIEYGFNSRVPIDQVLIPIYERTSMDGVKKAKMMKKLHEEVRSHIEKKTTKYDKHANKGQKMVKFELGVLVWIHLGKGKFPSKRKSKLMPRVDGPFQVVEKVNDNVCKVDLLGEYNVSTTFNAKDLSPYLKDVDDSDLRTNNIQPEGDDMHHDSNMERADINVYGHSDGLMTRARAKQVQSALTS